MITKEDLEIIMADDTLTQSMPSGAIYSYNVVKVNYRSIDREHPYTSLRLTGGMDEFQYDLSIGHSDISIIYKSGLKHALMKKFKILRHDS